jgi:hypothetical protein
MDKIITIDEFKALVKTGKWVDEIDVGLDEIDVNISLKRTSITLKQTGKYTRVFLQMVDNPCYAEDSHGHSKPINFSIDEITNMWITIGTDKYFYTRKTQYMGVCK